MGLWGAAQAIAFGIGGLAGSALSDLGRRALGSAASGFALVFAGEAGLFVFAAALALRAIPRASRDVERALTASSLEAPRPHLVEAAR